MNYGKLTFGGSKDCGFDVSKALENAELADGDNVTVMPDDPAELDITDVSVPETDVVVGNRTYRAGKAIIFRLTSLGNTAGEQSFKIRAVGNSGTDLTYCRSVEIVSCL